jgi:DNA-binding NarL/FixJ family response regulator
MNKIKVILVEDHEIVRDGIKLILSDSPFISIIGDVGSASALFNLLKTKDPDVIIMDIELPGMSGIEIVKILSKDFPKLKFLILSMSLDENTIFYSIKAGAKGFLHKNAKQQELIEAICVINSGGEYFSPKVSEIILKSYTEKAKHGLKIGCEPEKVLTIRELEILKHIKNGLSNPEIAERCHISIRTVEGHKDHIKNKLQFEKSTELIKFALQYNF